MSRSALLACSSCVYSMARTQIPCRIPLVSYLLPRPLVPLNAERPLDLPAWCLHAGKMCWCLQVMCAGDSALCVGFVVEGTVEVVAKTKPNPIFTEGSSFGEEDTMNQQARTVPHHEGCHAGMGASRHEGCHARMGASRHEGCHAGMGASRHGARSPSAPNSA